MAKFEARNRATKSGTAVSTCNSSISLQNSVPSAFHQNLNRPFLFNNISGSVPAFQFVRSIPKHEVVPSYVRFVTTDCRTLPATNHEAKNGAVRSLASPGFFVKHGTRLRRNSGNDTHRGSHTRLGKQGCSSMLRAVMHHPHAGRLEIMVKRSRALAAIPTADQLPFVVGLNFLSVCHVADGAMQNFES